MGKDQLLELFDLVLQCHEVGYCFISEDQNESKLKKRRCLSIPFIRIVNIFQTDIFFVFEEPIKLWMVSVETEFSQYERDICTNECPVS